MRIAIGLALLLWGLGWWAAGARPRSGADTPVHDERPWRRTIDGWEIVPTLAPHSSTGIEGLHPALLALLQVQAAALVLLAGQTASRPAGNPADDKGAA